MRTLPYSQVLANICGLIGVPTSRLTTETADAINNLLNSNVRQLWGAGNWPDLSVWGEARFCGDLLSYPNDNSNAAWTATNVTVTANAISNPADNKVTASKLLETTTNGQHNVSQVITAFPNTSYQASVYARPQGRNYLYLAVNDGTTTFSSFFNIQSGTIGNQSNVTSANIQQYANGYYLCTITYTTGANATSSTYTAGISTDGTTLSYAGDVTKGLYLWGNLLIQQTNVSPQQYILPWAQAGENEIDVMFQCWMDNPAMITYPRPQGFVVTDVGFQMISSAGGFMGTNGYVTYNTNPANPIYIYYRKVPYNYSGDVYSSTSTYVAGQYIYFTRTTGAQVGTSDYWKCLSATTAGQSPETHPSKWELQPVPEMIYQPLVWQTYADWLIQDGQADKAAQAYVIADQKKNEEWDRIQRQMPDTWQVKVSTHLSAQNRFW